MKPPFEHLHNKKAYGQLRRNLRNNATPAEAALWKLLKGSRVSGRKFRRQHGVGLYILDFYCPAERLAIELDGESHNDPLRHEYDGEREAYLAKHGIKVIRFENKQVFTYPELVIEGISIYFNS